MSGSSKIVGWLAGAAMAVMLGVAVLYSVWPDGKPQITGRALVRVEVPPLAPDLRQGRDAFERNCASCHGNDAAGIEGAGPPLVHRIYEPNHHGDEAFLRAARNGVPQHHWTFGNMPPIPEADDRDIGHIVAYVRRLQEANGIY